MSGEHVWPDWLADVAPGATADMWRVQRTIQTPDGPEIVAFETAPYSEKVHCVCAACNTGWMSDLEQAAAPHLTPMIQGAAQRLNDGAQTLVATWMALRTTVLDQVHGGAGVPPEHHRALYEHRQRGTRRPPTSTWAWLGKYENPGLHPPLYQGSPLHHLRPDGTLAGQDPIGYVATFTIGYLVCELIGGKDAVEDWSVPDSPQTRKMLCRVWPPFRTREWPPEITLEPRHVKQVADMFREGAGG